MSTAAERAAQLDLVARLKSAYPELPDAPTPDLLDHERITCWPSRAFWWRNTTSA
jgi:hypothetical protein